MKIIVTRQNDDGTYDNVGMNNRTLFSHYTTPTGALRYGVKPFSKGKKCRVEFFYGSIYDDPSSVIYWDPSI